MTSTTPIFTEEPRVNIPRSEYERLLEYEKICKDLEGAKKQTHPRKYDIYDIFCAVLYLMKEPWNKC